MTIEEARNKLAENDRYTREIKKDLEEAEKEYIGILGEIGIERMVTGHFKHNEFPNQAYGNIGAILLDLERLEARKAEREKEAKPTEVLLQMSQEEFHRIKTAAAMRSRQPADFIMCIVRSWLGAMN